MPLASEKFPYAECSKPEFAQRAPEYSALYAVIACLIDGGTGVLARADLHIPAASLSSKALSPGHGRGRPCLRN